MKLLLTKKRPLYAKNNDFLDAFEDFSSSAESVHISTGYVSVESLQYLLENAKAGALPYLELTIGMHHFDGFTRAQYDCAMSLASYLGRRVSALLSPITARFMLSIREASRLLLL
jgi:hypothetical protein